MRRSGGKRRRAGDRGATVARAISHVKLASLAGAAAEAKAYFYFEPSYRLFA